jgi:putative photosynthetic complex assembly protein 2
VVIETLLASTYAAFCWWFGTGLILWLDRLPARTFRLSMAVWSVFGALSFWGVAVSMQSVSIFSAYLGFGSVIVMWGWHELAFLTGSITGPRRVDLEPGVVGIERFRQSLNVVLHHELALLANFGILWIMQVGQPNHVALCTFALLLFMRISAKLNLYFGVPQNGAQYLPPHLAYLASYFPIRAMTPWFVFSFGAALGIWVWIVWQAQSGLVEVTTGWVLLASLLGLGILEHAMMMLPWPLERLWGWAIQPKAPTALS